MGHCTLTTFYAAAITRNLPWGSDQIVEKVALGAILHDIGKLKFPKTLQDKRPQQMTHEEMELYKSHHQEGFNLINNIKFVPTHVKQIVLQHHETNDGKGFPQGLPGLSIYPPAKIVAFADYFSHYLVHHKLKPIEAFNQFLKEREIVTLFDAEIIKALIKAFSFKGKE
jgi:putative nucleotidyltransferase with HDIG domain